MNRLGFIILSILEQNNAKDKLTSMSVREVLQTDELGYQENTIFKKMKEFEKSGCVGQGLKEGRAATFYITTDGCRILEKERTSEI